MSGSQQTVGRLGDDSAGTGPAAIVTCEHASNRLPARYRGLGLPASRLDSHIAWDPGARSVARRCGGALRCPTYEGRYSRLLIDLNRSPGHRKLIPVTAFGVPIPGNRRLAADERLARITRYYDPYRQSVIEKIADLISLSGRCVHLSVHSFVPVLHGVRRDADIGLLYDPKRTAERMIVSALAGSLRAHGLIVRLNYPYRGTADGFTTHCRRLWDDMEYGGIELEINQRLLRRHLHRGTGKLLAESVRGTLRRETSSSREGGS